MVKTCRKLSERFTKGVYIMNGNLAYGLGFVFGVIIFSAIIIIPMLIGITKDKKLKRKYDERQELIRGRGFKYAFYTMIALNMLYAISLIGLGELPVEESAVMIIIVFMSIGVYAWYTILNDGYFALNERVPQTVMVFSIIAIANFMIGINAWLDGGMVKDGVITFECLNLVCAIFMLITVLVILIKQHKDKKED